MKKIFLLIGLILLLPAISMSGQTKDLPQSIVFTANTGDQVEFMDITFHYKTNGNHWAEISYYPVDTDGNRRELEHVYLRDISDNPATVPADCTDAGIPYECCTGTYPGDPNDGCVETQTDFTDFVQGYASVLSSRSDSAVWADIQTKYTLAP